MSEMSDREFWQHVFLAAVRSGVSPSSARYCADKAVYYLNRYCLRAAPSEEQGNG